MRGTKIFAQLKQGVLIADKMSKEMTFVRDVL